MEVVLHCNNHKYNRCRKELKLEAIVTTCSHIFCKDCVREHRLDVARGERKCIACETLLPLPNDVAYIGLRPTEEHQSTILSGLSPSIIAECAARALRFWSYQMSTEIAWQEHVAKQWSEKFSGLRNTANKVIDEANTEISDLEKQIAALKDEKEVAQKQLGELAERYKEKSKACSQVQKLYDAIKLKVQTEHTRGAAAASTEHVLQSMGTSQRPETTSHHPLADSVLHTLYTNRKTHYTTRNHIDQYGVEILHPHQRSGSARGPTSSEVATAAAHAIMGPPTHSKTREAYRSQKSSFATPAQRTTLAPSNRNHTFPQRTAHRSSGSHQYTRQSVDRHASIQEKQRSYDSQIQPQDRRPNIHPCMTPNGGL